MFVWREFIKTIADKPNALRRNYELQWAKSVELSLVPSKKIKQAIILWDEKERDAAI